MLRHRLPDIIDVDRVDVAALGDVLDDCFRARAHVLVLGQPGHGRSQMKRAGTNAGPILTAAMTQYMCWPPLIDSVEPVMKPASSAIRNITPRAISSARPKRPTGIFATIFSSTCGGTARTMSVSM